MDPNATDVEFTEEPLQPTPAPSSERPPKHWYRPANLLRWTVALAGVICAIVVSPAVQMAGQSGNTDPAALWGLMPIGLYAILAISGMGILPSMLVALAACLMLAAPTLGEIGRLLVQSTTNQVTVIGLIIVLGAGVGGVLRESGVAQVIVAAVLHLFRHRGRRAIAAGIVFACLVLVFALGTINGGLAIAAPLLIPVAARLGYTRSTTAVLLFVGGCAGLAIAPFAGANVAIMQAAGVGYGTYLLFGGGPLALVTIIVGLLWTPVVQRHTAKSGDFYTDEEAADTSTPITTPMRKAAIVFAVVLALLVVFAIVTAIGFVFPLFALPILAVATGLAVRMPIGTWFIAVGRGMRSMLGIFVLFWLLSILFLIIDSLHPFDTLLYLLGPQLEASSPFIFSLVVAFVGWVAVPGATAAQVVLLDRVFGPMAVQIGVSPASWVVVLLFAAKADTYGPFPNPNMFTAMGLAHSTNLRAMLLTGWTLLIPAILVYTGILFFENL